MTENFISVNEENVFYCEDYPSVAVGCIFDGLQGFDDDFEYAVANYYLNAGYDALHIKRRVELSEPYLLRNGVFYMEINGMQDLSSFAEDASALIDYVESRTDFFEEHRGSIGFYANDGDKRFYETFPFGKLSEWDIYPKKYYKNPENFAEVISNRYTKMLEQNEEMEQFLHSDASENTVESSAALLYENVLKEQGYSFEPNYNAKGNFYAELGIRKDETTGNEYSYSIVYDRKSKNGQCELFVFYKTKIGETESEIVDMYAVHSETEQVIASGKRAWSDIGSEEYRKLTGE